MRFHRAIPRPITQLAKQILHIGSAYFCPICERTARRFQASNIEGKYRQNARCPWCHSLERHRLVWLVMHDLVRPGQRMLHFAPEKCIETRLRRKVGPSYVTADLFAPADLRLDLMNIEQPDSTYDLVYCSHVLEHVEDDIQAMREMRRILKPDGLAIIMVPINVESTWGDASITDPAERHRLFGQTDHFRLYGPDVVDRLAAAGFGVKAVKPADILSPDDIERMRITDKAGDVYLCSVAS